MSLMPYALYTTVSNATPLLDPNISVTLSNQVLNNSTINTSRIFLDGNYLDTTGSGSNAALLINGVPITGGSASTATSSITANWANFPAISTITYATSAGTGGSIIMCNVSSLVSQTGTLVSQVGSCSAMTVSTLNGSPYPINAGGTLIPASTQLTGVSATINMDFTGQAPGLYYINVLCQSTADPLSCSCVVRYSGGIISGGSYHQPVIGGVTNTNNYVSVQSDFPVGDSVIQIYVYSAAFPNTVVQTSAIRIL